MSIATDTRYRSIRVAFVNNDQDGSEFVQLIAKPAGGTWAAQRTFPVAVTADQEATWDTALPLTLYDIALRYMIGSVAAVGYESTDPDSWTSPHAAGSKSTVTTACAPATDLTGAYSSATGKASLAWACAQQSVPFLLEKNAGSGWVTVVADLVATSYQYTPDPAELNTNVDFRVTPKRGAIVGVVSNVATVYLGVLRGTPAVQFYTWEANGGTSNRFTAYISWTKIAAGATLDFVQVRSQNGAGWTEHPISAMTAPAVSDVPAQPDGYVPVTPVAITLANSPFNPDTPGANGWAIQIRGGVNSGSGIDWGAWTAASLNWASSALIPVTPTHSFSGLSATGVDLSLTVIGTVRQFGIPGTIPVPPPSSIFGAYYLDIGGTWGMMKSLMPIGVTASSLVFPTSWVGQSLYYTWIAQCVRPDFTPDSLHGAISADTNGLSSATVRRALIGVIG